MSRTWSPDSRWLWTTDGRWQRLVRVFSLWDQVDRRFTACSAVGGEGPKMVQPQEVT